MFASLLHRLRHANGISTLSLAVLQLAADKLPAGVDASQRQNYLSDAEFQSVFGMDKAAFEKLPGWKKTAAKKKADLF